MAVPLDLAVIDLGGGLEVEGDDPRCTIDQIRCIPLGALLEGLNAPGAWSTEPADMDLGSFLSSAMGPSVLWATTSTRSTATFPRCATTTTSISGSRAA